MRPAFLVVAFVLLALVESALGIIQPRRTASDADWALAAKEVRASFQPGDLIVFTPEWIDPVGRKYLGDLMPITMVGRSDADRYARIWQISAPGDAATAEARSVLPALDLGIGRLRLRRFDKTAVQVLRDLTTDFATARLFTHPRGTDEPERTCAADGDARRCGPSRVEPRVVEVDYRPRRAVLVPVAAGETIVLEHPDVPGGLLVGYAGLHDYYARKNADGAALVRVRVDETQSITVPIRNEDGWKRFELPLAPGTHRVRIEIDAEQPAWRLVGVHAEVRAP